MLQSFLLCRMMIASALGIGGLTSLVPALWPCSSSEISPNRPTKPNLLATFIVFLAFRTAILPRKSEARELSIPRTAGQNYRHGKTPTHLRPQSSDRSVPVTPNGWPVDSYKISLEHL